MATRSFSSLSGTAARREFVWASVYALLYALLSLYGLFFVVAMQQKSDPSPLLDRATVAAVLPVFRAFLLPIILAWLWSAAAIVMEDYGIAYHTVVFPPFLPAQECRTTFHFPNTLTIVWLFGLLTYLGDVAIDFVGIDAKDLVLIFTVCMVAAMLWPLKLRVFLVRTLWEVLKAPFAKATFVENFVADFMTSMSRDLFDIYYVIRFCSKEMWGSGGHDKNDWVMPILAALPLYFRLMQCFRRYRDTRQATHLGNAGKYTLSLAVVVYGRLHGNFAHPPEWHVHSIMWVFFFIASTLYSFLWDIFVDWKLFVIRRNGNRSCSFREHRAFSIGVYLYLIVSNFLLRFCWTMTITPAAFHIIGVYHELFVLLTASLEVFRRVQWSIFRIENELLCGGGGSSAMEKLMHGRV